jgi:hypothetical protein
MRSEITEIMFLTTGDLDDEAARHPSSQAPPSSPRPPTASPLHMGIAQVPHSRSPNRERNLKIQLSAMAPRSCFGRQGPTSAKTTFLVLRKSYHPLVVYEPTSLGQCSSASGDAEYCSLACHVVRCDVLADDVSVLVCHRRSLSLDFALGRGIMSPVPKLYSSAVAMLWEV